MDWKKPLADLIQKGIEQGEFKTGVDAEAVSFSLVAIIEVAGLLALRPGRTKYKTRPWTRHGKW